VPDGNSIFLHPAGYHAACGETGRRSIEEGLSELVRKAVVEE